MRFLCMRLLDQRFLFSIWSIRDRSAGVDVAGSPALFWEAKQWIHWQHEKVAKTLIYAIFCARKKLDLICMWLLTYMLKRYACFVHYSVIKNLLYYVSACGGWTTASSERGCWMTVSCGGSSCASCACTCGVNDFSLAKCSTVRLMWMNHCFFWTFFIDMCYILW